MRVQRCLRYVPLSPPSPLPPPPPPPEHCGGLPAHPTSVPTQLAHNAPILHNRQLAHMGHPPAQQTACFLDCTHARAYPAHNLTVQSFSAYQETTVKHAQVLEQPLMMHAPAQPTKLSTRAAAFHAVRIQNPALRLAKQRRARCTSLVSPHTVARTPAVQRLRAAPAARPAVHAVPRCDSTFAQHNAE